MPMKTIGGWNDILAIFCWHFFVTQYNITQTIDATEQMRTIAFTGTIHM